MKMEQQRKDLEACCCGALVPVEAIVDTSRKCSNFTSANHCLSLDFCLATVYQGACLPYSRRGPDLNPGSDVKTQLNPIILRAALARDSR